LQAWSRAQVDVCGTNTGKWPCTLHCFLEPRLVPNGLNADQFTDRSDTYHAIFLGGCGETISRTPTGDEWPLAHFTMTPSHLPYPKHDFAIRSYAEPALREKLATTWPWGTGKPWPPLLPPISAPDICPGQYRHRVPFCALNVDQREYIFLMLLGQTEKGCGDIYPSCSCRQRLQGVAVGSGQGPGEGTRSCVAGRQAAGIGLRCARPPWGKQSKLLSRPPYICRRSRSEGQEVFNLKWRYIIVIERVTCITVVCMMVGPCMHRG
jgi:hypothetical protein